MSDPTLRTFAAGEGTFRAATQAAEWHAYHAIFTDVHVQRWRVADVRQCAQPRVYRRPPDPDATHRVFQREGDRLLAVCDLAYTRPVLQYHGVADDAVSALSRALEHALDRTPRAHKRLAR